MDPVLRNTFEEIYDSFASELYRYVQLRISDKEAVEDVMADMFVRFWKRQLSGQAIQNPRALLYSIAHGLIVDAYRRAGVRAHAAIEDVEESALGVEDDTEEFIARRQSYEEIVQSLDKIHPDYKDLILLHYVQDVPISEIAEIVQKKEGTVRVQLHRALKALKQHI